MSRVLLIGSNVIRLEIAYENNALIPAAVQFRF